MTPCDVIKFPALELEVDAFGRRRELGVQKYVVAARRGRTERSRPNANDEDTHAQRGRAGKAMDKKKEVGFQYTVCTAGGARSPHQAAPVQ